MEEYEQRYEASMQSLRELRAEYDALNDTNRQLVADGKAKLEAQQQELEAKAREFRKQKRDLVLASKHSRTGKPMSAKVAEQLEATETRKEAEVSVVRLDNIKLRGKLRRHEGLLRQKEELADGLHLIDFEQLKIENHAFNEKIEERNEVCAPIAR